MHRSRLHLLLGRSSGMRILFEEVEWLAGQATIEASTLTVPSDALQVADCYDRIRLLRFVHYPSRYHVDFVFDGFSFLMPPLPNDSGFAYRPPQPEVSASYPPDLFPVEVGFAVLDCCSQFPYAHVDWEDACVLAFESGVLLGGDVHEPVLAVPNQ